MKLSLDLNCRLAPLERERDKIIYIFTYLIETLCPKHDQVTSIYKVKLFIQMRELSGPQYR